MLSRLCPLCKSRDSKILFIKSNYAILKCYDCSFVFVGKLPTKLQISQFYRGFDYKNPTKAEFIIRKDAKRSLSVISRFIKPVDLLDIGCGRGYFLDEARMLGWKVLGLDYSREVSEYAKSKLGIKVLNKDILHFESSTKYKLVILNQVIEHFADPKKIIEKCHGVLKKHGYIYIATPNIESLAAKVAKEDFDHIIPPEHLSYFNKTTLIRILEENGFRVIYSGTWSYPQDLAGIIKKLMRKNKGPVESKRVKRHINLTKNDAQRKQSLTKNIKHILFDKIFCNIFYRILNIGYLGINLEVIAQKV